MYINDQKFSQRLHIDIPLLCGIGVLMLFGLIILYSAGSGSVELLQRQLIRLALALGVILLFAQIPPTYYRTWSPWLYALGLVLLIAVALFGEVRKGGQRWINLGVTTFQPSEIMKLAIPMMLAWYLSTKKLPPHWKDLLIAFVLLLIPALLIIEQPDLGTGILIAASGLFVLFLSGISYRFIFLVAAIAAASFPLLWTTLHEYQKKRIITLFNPEHDPLGSGYHIIQSTIAVGSGGLYGKGWMNGTQSNLQFLPERSTDFIFAVYGEEFGFIGAIILLIVYLLVIGRGLYIASQAQETFTRLLAGGITLTFAFYVIVNAGMVIGLLPVVGIPMPLLSYGGTSLITLSAGFGMLMSIQTHRKIL
ncbi:MAG: rod shape-determining protein RodA [Gammaproteobacteria bacterium]